MTEEEGCWNCKYDELEAGQEPCNVCDFHEPLVSKWERGEQVSILQSSTPKVIK